MKSFAWPMGLLIGLVAIPLIEAPASACSPPPPGLTSSIPASGDTYPANAALLFYGFDISLDAVTVTVDGQPASFKAAPDVGGLGFGALAARIDPAPAKGQMVNVSGDFCAQVAQCAPVSISFTAGDADLAPPAAPTAIAFDLYDYPDFKSSGGDCQSDSDLGWWIDVTAAPPGAADSKVTLIIEASPDETFQKIAFTESTFVSSAKTTLQARHTVNVLGGADAPEALCFRASLRDIAGNAAADTVQVCKPCNYRKEPGVAQDFSPAQEPKWTAADIYPSGTCDDGSGPGGSGGGGAGGAGGTGGSGAGGSGFFDGEHCDFDCDEGCGCRFAGTERSDAGYAALALLGGIVIARKRRAANARS